MMIQKRPLLLPLVMMIVPFVLAGCFEPSPVKRFEDLEVMFWVAVDPANGLALSVSEVSLMRGPGEQGLAIHLKDRRDEKTGRTLESMAVNADGELLAKAEILEEGRRVRVESGVGAAAILKAVGFREVYVEQRGAAWTRIFMGPRGDLVPGAQVRDL